MTGQFPLGIKPNSRNMKNLSIANIMTNITAIIGYLPGGLMKVTITLTDKEIIFLQRMIAELNNYQKKQVSIEDAIHECIRMATYEESEEGV